MKKGFKLQDLNDINKTSFLEKLYRNQNPKKQKPPINPINTSNKKKKSLSIIDSNVIKQHSIKTPKVNKKITNSPGISSSSKVTNKCNQIRIPLQNLKRKVKNNMSDLDSNLQQSYQLSDRPLKKNITPSKIVCVSKNIFKVKQLNNKQKTLLKSKIQQKQINKSLVNYLKYFKTNTIGIRPMKWSLNQLEKAIQQIYNQLFNKISYLSQINKSISQIILKNQQFSQQISPFHKLILDLYSQKFKSSKLSSFHIVNLIYTLSYYQLQEINKIQKLSLEIFSKFIIKYDSQLLVFFLCSRNMMEKAFGIRFIHIWQKKHNQIMNSNFMLNEKKLVTFLKVILEGENNLINKYKDIIFLNSSVKQVHFYQILSKLMSDFIEKKTCEDYTNDNDTEQLFNTPQLIFPNRNLQFIQNWNKKCQQVNLESFLDSQFWKCKNVLYTHVEDQLQGLIIQKLQIKLQKLIDIVANQYNKSQKTKIFKITYRKAINLMHSIFIMNNTAWFEQLGIKKANKKDIQIFQNLNQQILQIKINHEHQKYKNDKNISNLCKNLLTINIFIRQLQKIILSLSH